LKDYCKKYIFQHYNSVVKTEDFKNLISTENRELIMEIMQELSAPATSPKKKRKVFAEEENHGAS